MVWHDAVPEIKRLGVFVEACLSGLEASAQAVSYVDLQRRVAATLRKPDPFPTPESYETAKQHAERLQQLASEEEQKGFPYLFGLATVRLWSILEAMVDEIAVEYLKDPGSCEDVDLIRSLKGPLVDFVNAAPDEQAEFLANELKLAVKAALKPGVGRFEAILEPLGIGGGVDENVRRAFIELSQLRNAIVHCGGVADKRFVEACRWLGYAVGQRLRPTRLDFRIYELAVMWYIAEISARIARRQGDKDSAEQQLRDELTPKLAELYSARANNGVASAPAS